MSIHALVSLIFALATPGSSSPTMPQSGGCFSSVMATFDSAATREDSLALGERLLEHHPSGETCGRLVAGYLFGMASTSLEDDWPLRQRASDLLDAGLRGNESEPRLFFALGIVLYNRNSRTDADRMLNRAVDRIKNARPPLSPKEEAHLHYTRGMIYQDYWRDYRSYGTIKTTFGGQFTCSKLTEDTSFTTFFFLCPDDFDSLMPVAFTSMRDMRMHDYEKMEDEFRAALRAYPAHEEAKRRLFEEYLYDGDYEKAYDMVRRLMREKPEDPLLIAVSAAILHGSGRDSLAELTFDRALALMPDEARRVYADLNRLVTPSDSTRFALSDSGMQANAERGFWNSVDPIFLTSFNERKLEHYTRVATADLLFGAPTMGLRGWDTDGGQIWIRYGRPRRIYELYIDSGRDIFWVYEGTLRFFFTRNLTYRRYAFGSDLSYGTSETYKRVEPHRGSTRTLVHELVTLDRQIVRLYDKGGLWNVHLYAARPLGFGPETRVGFTLLNADFAPLVRKEARIPGAIAVQVPSSPGKFAVVLELWNQGYGRLGRVRDTITVDSLGDGLAVSDILVATRIRQRSNRRPASMDDLEVFPSYGLVLPVRQPIGLYWEIYGLTPDSTGAVRYEVAFQVRRAGSNMPSRVLRGLFGRSDGGPMVRYDGVAPASPDGRTIEWLEIEGPASVGQYQIAITVRDRVTGATFGVTRNLALRGNP